MSNFDGCKQERGESGERERTKMSGKPESPSTFPLSPFIGEVGREVFIISLGEACWYLLTHIE
jgi:hypothetical protein